MNFKAIALSCAMLLGTGVSANAQALLDGNSIDEILNLARGYGSANIEEQSNGDPKITGKIEGVQYAVYFMNCTDKKDCEDLNFYAGFLDTKPTLDTINAWNRDKRFGKAYLDSDNDAVIEFDVNLEHGISRDNMDAAFSVWSLVLGQYVDYVGFK